MDEKNDAEAAAKAKARRIASGEILSGGLMECAGTIRRVRWALVHDLTPAMQAVLLDMESGLAETARQTHEEARALEASAEFALAAPGERP